MPNTRVVEASKVNVDVAAVNLTTPCIIHASSLAVGDLVIVEVAPTNTESEYTPYGQDSTIKGGGGGLLLLDFPTGFSYFVRIKFRASPSRVAADPGADVYRMTP